MRIHRLICRSLAAFTLFSAATAALAQDAPLPACFAPTLTEDIVPRFPVMGAYVDELSQLAAKDERVRGMTVYLLARQMTLLERVQRRLQSHSSFGCDLELRALKRDFAMLRLTNTAFMQGNSELEIARLESEQASNLLARIDSELVVLGDAIAALQPSSTD
ncbi:MAG: hypothetical protein WC000_10085 [Dokdonella sp.]|jgi:hypothetical protein